MYMKLRWWMSVSRCQRTFGWSSTRSVDSKVFDPTFSAKTSSVFDVPRTDSDPVSPSQCTAIDLVSSLLISVADLGGSEGLGDDDAHPTRHVTRAIRSAGRGMRFETCGARQSFTP